MSDPHLRAETRRNPPRSRENTLRLLSTKELLAMEDPPRKHVAASRLTEPLTWALLCRLEPRLVRLERDIRSAAARTPRTALSNAWYAEFKPRLVALVGWDRADDDHTTLASEAAFDLAFDHLQQLLIRRPR